MSKTTIINCDFCGKTFANCEHYYMFPYDPEKGLPTLDLCATCYDRVKYSLCDVASARGNDTSKEAADRVLNVCKTFEFWAKETTR